MSSIPNFNKENFYPQLNFFQKYVKVHKTTKSLEKLNYDQLVILIKHVSELPLLFLNLPKQ